MQEIKIGDMIHREVFHGKTMDEIKQKMDARAREAEKQGGTVVRRTKIGRNDPCPCDSGLKFKKCHVNRLDELNALLSSKPINATAAA